MAAARIPAPEALEDREEAVEEAMANLSHKCGSLSTSSSPGNGEEALAEVDPAEAVSNTMADTNNEYSSKIRKIEIL